jgi:SNF2 family DNA or RNA helicase
MNVEALSTKRGADFLFSVAKAYPDMLLAVDESTTIKSRTAARTKALTRIAKHVKYKRILTGSPITQSPLDLFSQCEFLERGCLQQASYWGFLNRYAKVQRRTLGAHSFQQVMGYQNLDELNRIIQPFSYRVRKEECLDLPDKVYVQREVEFTPEQKAAYNTMKKAAMAFLAEGQVTASTVLSQMLRMQQICSGYVKTDEGVLVELPTNKIKALMAAIEETDGKMIIWCNFTHDLKRVAAELKAVYGEQSYRLFYGDVSTEDRTDIVNQFQDPASPLRFFVGQPRSGGYGLTLTEAKTVIYYSNGFDLEVRLQSEDRAHRIGQTNKVTYIDIVTAQSVDSKILFALRRKLNLATEVMAEGYKKWLV